MTEAATTSEEYLEKLERLKTELERLPLVNSVLLYPERGSAPTWNQMGVRLSLPAAFVGTKSRRQPNVHCSLEKPTQLDALLAMKEKLLSEFESELQAAAIAAAAASTPAHTTLSGIADGAPGSVAPMNAFERMRAAALAHEGLKRSVRESEWLLGTGALAREGRHCSTPCCRGEPRNRHAKAEGLRAEQAPAHLRRRRNIWG